MKYLCIVQARMGSTRFPGKVLERVNGETVLEYMTKRLAKSRKIDTIIVATSNKPLDDAIADLCQKIDCEVFRGSEEDVLDRFYQCSLKYPDYDAIIRVTGDCPLIDPVVIDEVISLFEDGNYDYANNVDPTPTFPDGLDTEIFTRQALFKAVKDSSSKKDREHVTLFMRNSAEFKRAYVFANEDHSNIRLTLDNPEDLEVIKFLVKHSSIEDSFKHYISLLDNNPEIKNKNAHIMRNAGLSK